MKHLEEQTITNQYEMPYLINNDIMHFECRNYFQIIGHLQRSSVNTLSKLTILIKSKTAIGEHMLGGQMVS